MVAIAGSTRSLISHPGTSQRRAASKRFPRRDRASCRQKQWCANDMSPRLGPSKAARTVTMVFAPPPLAPIKPKASSVDTIKTAMGDGDRIAALACQRVEHDRGRHHERSALQTDTLKPAIGGWVGADQSISRPERASTIGRDGVSQPWLDFSYSGHSGDTLFGRLTRKETIQMSLDLATTGDVRRSMSAHTRG
jgi:hypothetical protein